MAPAEAISFLLERLRRTSDNEEFLDSMKAGE
jgi:transcription termination factor Rho